jgi:alanyl-tRNA synthetase
LNKNSKNKKYLKQIILVYIMDRKELIQKYIEFFKLKNHKEIKNASLVPENDPTVLFTTAGMHPLTPFLLGQPHPQGKRLTNVQKCIRTGDIEEVGNTTHHTFFEMLGNWSLGDYFKKEAIEMSFEFLTKHLNIPLKRFAVTIFEGDNDAPKDHEAAKIWESLGIKKERIAFLPKKDNWWGPAGNTGPCGPDTEMFYWKLNDIPAPKTFNPKNKNWVEIWNDVLMGYEKNKEGKIIEAKQKNIDTGMGVERMITILNGFEDNYLSNMWQPLIKKIEKLSNKTYKENEKAMRVIADHIKAAVFIINDGIIPGTAEQGYVLRRLIRRAVRFGKELGLSNFTKKIAEPIFEIYDDYEFKKEFIIKELEKEEEKFTNTLTAGLKKFKKLTKNTKKLSGIDAFLLYQSFGFPIEMIIEECKKEKINFSPGNFKAEQKKHQELSQTASARKFKSGLSDNSETTTKLHTATHMLLAALKKVLNKNINQKGSNITPERLRFDFNFNRKLTEEEKKKIEDLINQEIQKKHTITREEMTPKEAKDQGAIGIFDNKYKGTVSVYTIGPINNHYSKEICTGPHVKNTKEMGIFKIKKEESVAAGIRRIKAILI